MARLKIDSVDGRRVVELQAINTLGRHHLNSIALVDPAVSKGHCTIERRGPSFMLRDLGSKNGTFVGGLRVESEVALRGGDEIVLAGSNTHLVFEDDPPRATSHPRMRSLELVEAHVELQDEQPRNIGTQIPVQDQGFIPYERLAANASQLALDYERLRICYELTRAIAVERDLHRVLDAILDNLRRIVRAERGVILIKNELGELMPGASYRSDGSGETIQVSKKIVRHAMERRAAVLTEDAVQELLIGGGGREDTSVIAMMRSKVRSAMAVPLVHDENVLGAIWLDSSGDAEFNKRDVELVSGIAGQASLFIHKNLLARQVEQETMLRERLSRLLSPNIAEHVANGRLEIKKGGQLFQDCVVFNSDIRGFTAMSEGTRPELIVDMLNDYFERMVEVLFRYDGTLDKFMGDGLMALWGAPVPCDDAEVRSVDCALDMLVELRRFNDDRATKGHPPLRIGIGIHSGPLVAGYVGSSQTLSYTAIGDTVNTSARICGVAAGDQLLVSEPTLERLGDRFTHRELPTVQLKGKEVPQRIFEITGRRG